MMQRRDRAGQLFGRRAVPVSEADTCALVTGASRGLGLAFAEVLAELGMNLLMVALPAPELEDAAASVADRYGVNTFAFGLDLAEPDAPERLVNWVEGQALPVSAVVNNAGVSYNHRFEDSSLRENAGCILLNNLALVQITRLMLPELQRRRRGYVLNVASLAAFFPMPYQTVYAPTKAFVMSFSLGLREELRKSTVSVSVLCPGGIPTTEASIRKIQAGGVAAKITATSAERVARAGAAGMFSGKAVIIPGALNRMVAVASRIAPRPVAHAVISRIYGNAATMGAHRAERQGFRLPQE